jgi:hypothetical protein
LRATEARFPKWTLSTMGRFVNGGNATEFYLNRKQAIFITAKSETDDATDITIEIIKRFDTYERGDIRVQTPLPQMSFLSSDRSFVTRIRPPRRRH